MRGDNQVLLQQDPQERRRHRRKKTFWLAKLETPLGCVECRVLDFTSRGAKVRLLLALALDQPVMLILDPLGRFSGKVVWQRDGCVGIRFTSRHAISDNGHETTSEASDAMTCVLEPTSAATSVGGSASLWDSQTNGDKRVPDILARTSMAPSIELDNMLAVIDHLQSEWTALLLQPGQVLFKEGDLSGCMYVLRSGMLRIKSGHVVYEDVERGGIVGEMGVVDKHQPRSATVFALTGSHVVEIDEQRFLWLLDQSPEFALGVMRILARRLRTMDQLYRPERSAELHR